MNENVATLTREVPKTSPSPAHPEAKPELKPAHPQVLDEHDMPKDLKRPHAIVIILVTLAFLALLAGMFVVGWLPHERVETQAKGDAVAQANSVPIVTVAPPRLSKATVDIHVPCDVRPNMETAIFARTTGYLNKLNVDIGQHVKKDDLLAQIDAPDVDAQLRQTTAAIAQSQANLKRAQFDYDYTKRTLDRYKQSHAENNAVGVQELDDQQALFDKADATLFQARASVEVATADQARLETMQGFEKILAPFSGIITARNVDLGALISPGTTSGDRELFHLAQIDIVRVFVNVPQVDAANIKEQQDAFLSVRNYPGVVFQGHVARTSHDVSAATRTILFELDFDNTDGRLYPGMYGTATIHVSQPPALVIDAGALIFDAQGAQVVVVKDGIAHFQPVTIARDLGTELEIATGLNAGDQVVTNPGQRLVEGVKVDARPAAAK